MTILYVTYCSGKKRQGVQRVEDLYVSDRIRNFIEVCSSKGLTWAILSAKYGLLFPGSTVEPYDVTVRSVRCKSCFLGLRVFVNGEKLPIPESNKHLTELCTRISSRLLERGVRKVVFYAPNPYRAKSYIKILQSALEDCRNLPVDKDILDYIKKKGQIEIVTKREDLKKRASRQ